MKVTTRLLLVLRRGGLIETRNMSIDASQMAYLAEKCILVDERDNVVGSATKQECHMWKNIEGGGFLHRAFSVFLFNEKREMLLQQRADEKITFPQVWTNACCSHPLYNAVELEEAEQIGVKRAAKRKLQHELGIDLDENSLIFLQKFLYKAGSGDGRLWGEHELDYALIGRYSGQFMPNSNEVKNLRFVDEKALIEMMEDPSFTFSPWFTLIRETGRLTDWWRHLSGDLEKFRSEQICKLN